MNMLLNPPYLVSFFIMGLLRVTLWSGLQLAALWLVSFGS